MPDEARTQDAAGAEAFVRYYIELINRTSTVMDASPSASSATAAATATASPRTSRKAAAAGKDYEGGEMTIIKVGQPQSSRTAPPAGITVRPGASSRSSTPRAVADRRRL